MSSNNIKERNIEIKRLSEFLESKDLSFDKRMEVLNTIAELINKNLSESEAVFKSIDS